MTQRMCKAIDKLSSVRICFRAHEITPGNPAGSGRYARLEYGKWTWRDEQRISRLLADLDARAAITAIQANVQDAAMAAGPADLNIDDSHNLGERLGP